MSRYEPMTTACECEHISHFDDGDGHRYGHECDVEDMTEVRTTWGTFRVCAGCRGGHVAAYVENERRERMRRASRAISEGNLARATARPIESDDPHSEGA